MTQQTLTLDGALAARTSLEILARRHAARHGLTFVRCEMQPGLFERVEVAVLRRADGQVVRRTAEMIRDAG